MTLSANIKQSWIAAFKANRILGLIRRNTVQKEGEIIIPLYKSIIRPHLDYGIQVWPFSYKKDLAILERIRNRATKLITALRQLSYKDRLKHCYVATLETRMNREDQIDV